MREEIGADAYQTPHGPPVCVRVYVCLHWCVREEMGRNGLRKRGRVRMASGIPGLGGKLANLFSQKRIAYFPSTDNSGLSASLMKRQISDSDIVSAPVRPCGTIKCPEVLFPCPKESTNYLLSSHSCPFLFAQIYWCVCVFLCVILPVPLPLLHPVYLSGFLSLSKFMCETLLCMQCCSSQGLT